MAIDNNNLTYGYVWNEFIHPYYSPLALCCQLWLNMLYGIDHPSNLGYWYDAQHIKYNNTVQLLLFVIDLVSGVLYFVQSLSVVKVTNCSICPDIHPSCLRHSPRFARVRSRSRFGHFEQHKFEFFEQSETKHGFQVGTIWDETRTQIIN